MRRRLKVCEGCGLLVRETYSVERDYPTGLKRTLGFRCGAYPELSRMAVGFENIGVPRECPFFLEHLLAQKGADALVQA